MRLKKTSDTLKRHHQTFHLARRDPEGWEHERNISLSESLHEVRERVGIVEREAETNKRLLRHSQQQVKLVIAREDELLTHKT